MSGMTLVGVGGARRNACAAVCVDGDDVAACEQERLTRTRRAGCGDAGWPEAAVDEVLALAERRPGDVGHYVFAESGVQPPPQAARVSVQHHRAHAATAWLAAAHAAATIVVCDTSGAREVSVWRGTGNRLDELFCHWRGPGFATLYSDCATVFGFTGPGRERQLEAAAHLGSGLRAEQLRELFQGDTTSLRVAPDWQARLHAMVADERQRSGGDAVEMASAVQCRIGELLLAFLQTVRAAVDDDVLCLGGGLFYNTYFTTLVRRANLFADVVVPINPGNAGNAVGAALLVGLHRGLRPARPVSPFLGAAYDAHAIKATLDACKLSYSFASPAGVLDATADALLHGHMVGWFHGRMEWGHKALGHRSILADPRSPYVLDNLNVYLRKRERSHPFGLSVTTSSMAGRLCGPPESPFMQYEYETRGDTFRHVLPAGARTIRVQTVAPDSGPFSALLARMEQATGVGALVNTSLNGFHEPIACTPRDAIRVFYGTGLDMLVLDQFILRK